MKGEKKRTDAKEKEDPAHLLETLNCLSFRKKQMHWNASPLLHRAHLNPTLTALLPRSLASYVFFITFAQNTFCQGGND
jgi:hypothetical protein